MSKILILTVAYLIFAIPLSIMDSRKFRISLIAVLIGSISLLLCRYFLFPSALLPQIKNVAIATGSSFLIYFCTRVLSGEGLGWGDVFFGIFSAIYTGFYTNIIATVFAALLGMLYYLFLAAIQKFKKKNFVHRPIFAIPFVPFITAGNVLSVILFFVIA